VTARRGEPGEALRRRLRTGDGVFWDAEWAAAFRSARAS
jgi:hypothetical protein